MYLQAKCTSVAYVAPNLDVAGEYDCCSEGIERKAYIIRILHMTMVRVETDSGARLMFAAVVQSLKRTTSYWKKSKKRHKEGGILFLSCFGCECESGDIGVYLTPHRKRQCSLAMSYTILYCNWPFNQVQPFCMTITSDGNWLSDFILDIYPSQ